MVVCHRQDQKRTPARHDIFAGRNEKFTGCPRKHIRRASRHKSLNSTKFLHDKQHWGALGTYALSTRGATSRDHIIYVLRVRTFPPVHAMLQIHSMSTNLLKYHNQPWVGQGRKSSETSQRSRTLSAQLGTAHKSRRISWNINRDDKLIKNRKMVNGHLQRLGHLIKKELSLNADGLCYFPYKKFIIVVEVPEDNGGVVLIYTMCCRLCNGDDRNAVLLAAMKLNYMQVSTRGGSLGIDQDEVNLCCSLPCNHLSRDDFISCLEDFLQTASEMNECLEAAKGNTEIET